MKTPAGTVYVIDDDVSVRRALTRLLRVAGYRVVACASAHEFLSIEGLSRPLCLVVDVRMPGQTGFDLHEALCAASGRLPVVFVTGHGDPAMAAKAITSGAVAFLLKPVEQDQLLDAVARGLAADASSSVPHVPPLRG